jgi:hypothetical protein
MSTGIRGATRYNHYAGRYITFFSTAAEFVVNCFRSL